jgi:large subunit ribosomal protein L23
MHNIIRQLLMTEKSSSLAETANQFVFDVPQDANKIQIRQAVEKLLGKKILSVRTLNVKGKARRAKRADSGVSAKWKKAIVKLKQGEKIELV